MTENAMGALYKALAAAQAEIKAPPKNKKAKIEMKTGGAFTYQYADLADCIAAVHAAFPKHGLAVFQPTVVEHDDGGRMSMHIRTVIAHADGATIESVYPVCSVGGDHKTMGGALTYARRYALASLCGIAPDEDTDSEGAAEPSAPAPRPGRQSPPARSTQAVNATPPTDNPFDEAAGAKAKTDVPGAIRKHLGAAGDCARVDQIIEWLKERRHLVDDATYDALYGECSQRYGELEPQAAKNLRAG